MKKRRPRPGKVLITSGVVLLLAALLLACYNVWDSRRAAEFAQTAAADLTEDIREVQKANDQLAKSARTEENREFIPDYQLDPTRDMPSEEIDGVAYVGLLEIPALELSLPVIDQWSYPGLRLSSCRYTGTAYLPGFVIAAHNYERHFGHIKDLSQGDAVVYTDMSGNVFTYTVVGIEVLAPTDIETMVSDEWDLTLFTCTLSGRARVSVRCIRASDGD